MSRVVLEQGAGVAVDPERALGPLPRLLLTAVVPHERSSRAERGRALARDGRLHSVTFADGTISAHALGSEDREYDVRLDAPPISRRAWVAAVTSPEGSRLLDDLLAGRSRAVQLEHTLTVDWSEPLVPQRERLRRSCTCPDIEWSGTCKHVIALAYVAARAIDDDPTLLLLWRGCRIPEPGGAPDPDRAEPGSGRDPWEAGTLPPPDDSRPLPVAAVLKRLGPSGIDVDGRDLVVTLERAYASFLDDR